MISGEDDASDMSQSNHGGVAQDASDGSTPYRLYEKSSLPARVLMLMLMAAHVASFIAGLSMKWSLTEVRIDTEPANPEVEGTVPLYKSTLWSNTREFWWSGAGAVSAIVVFSGVVQPIWKALMFLVIYAFPLSDSRRMRLITAQEFTGKLSLATFYVEAILLQCFDYSFQVAQKSQALFAKIKIIAYEGLVMFLIAQLFAMAVINCLRLLQRSAMEENHRSLALYDLLPQVPSGKTRKEAASDLRAHTLWSRVRLGAASFLSILFFWYLFEYPTLKFTATGLLAPYIVRNGPVLRLAFDSIGWGIFENTNPHSFAVFFAIAFYVNLIIFPNMLSILGLASAITPESWRPAQRAFGEATQLILPWATHETLIIAIFFLCPNINLISEWVFDDTEPCPTINHKTHGGGNCLVVDATVLAVGGSLLILWGLLVLYVSACVAAKAGDRRLLYSS
uniref:Uncharacterized protein n=1 Tax=Rhizochromulina marina TaxID=1034831 RepID=A0A7S2RY33_9STRA|mmetsp:Transcript_22565/g.65616  ORF Transcript_22565/g.65616 Transcript_22565/m.65616 type:complete len:451 (+) Transcript_22565:82-1434(+)